PSEARELLQNQCRCCFGRKSALVQDPLIAETLSWWSSVLTVVSPPPLLAQHVDD
ncbi:hypothetical protein A2U01_0010995, partial [Trifolium medium]|nr:hypothetical protein [Trifolium medium]